MLEEFALCSRLGGAMMAFVLGTVKEVSIYAGMSKLCSAVVSEVCTWERPELVDMLA